jgi:hypothetical protein
MKNMKLGTKNLGIVATILSVCLLFSIGSFVVTTKAMQASAQPPDHLHTPHTGIINQIPERATLLPVQPIK